MIIDVAWFRGLCMNISDLEELSERLACSYSHRSLSLSVMDDFLRTLVGVF